jgi:hypothetical protein
LSAGGDEHSQITGGHDPVQLVQSAASRHIAPSASGATVTKQSSVAATFSPLRTPLITDATADSGR